MLNNQKELILLKDLGMQYATSKSKNKKRYGLYKCFCGNEFRTCGEAIKRGHTQSCGCLRGEKNKIHATTHGKSEHRLYAVWKGMKNRCYNLKNTGYKYYGGRGISICDRWLDIENFIDDMYPSFQEGLTIDREDNNGNYEPSNCRWASKATQARNTRRIISTNTSGFRGVSWNTARKKWIVMIRVNSKKIYLGRFLDKNEAAIAYDKYIIDNNLEHSRNFN